MASTNKCPRSLRGYHPAFRCNFPIASGYHDLPPIYRTGSPEWTSGLDSILDFFEHPSTRDYGKDEAKHTVQLGKSTIAYEMVEKHHDLNASKREQIEDILGHTHVPEPCETSGGMKDYSTFASSDPSAAVDETRTMADLRDQGVSERSQTQDTVVQSHSLKQGENGDVVALNSTSTTSNLSSSSLLQSLNGIDRASVEIRNQNVSASSQSADVVHVSTLGGTTVREAIAQHGLQLLQDAQFEALEDGKIHDDMDLRSRSSISDLSSLSPSPPHVVYVPDEASLRFKGVENDVDDDDNDNDNDHIAPAGLVVTASADRALKVDTTVGEEEQSLTSDSAVSLGYRSEELDHLRLDTGVALSPARRSNRANSTFRATGQTTVARRLSYGGHETDFDFAWIRAHSKPSEVTTRSLQAAEITLPKLEKVGTAHDLHRDVKSDAVSLKVPEEASSPTMVVASMFESESPKVTPNQLQIPALPRADCSNHHVKPILLRCPVDGCRPCRGGYIRVLNLKKHLEQKHKALRFSIDIATELCTIVASETENGNAAKIAEHQAAPAALPEQVLEPQAGSGAVAFDAEIEETNLAQPSEKGTEPVELGGKREVARADDDSASDVSASSTIDHRVSSPTVITYGQRHQTELENNPRADSDPTEAIPTRPGEGTGGRRLSSVIIYTGKSSLNAARTEDALLEDEPAEPVWQKPGSLENGSVQSIAVPTSKRPRKRKAAATTPDIKHADGKETPGKGPGRKRQRTNITATRLADPIENPSGLAERVKLRGRACKKI